jgi:hypothetical protein
MLLQMMQLQNRNWYRTFPALAQKTLTALLQEDELFHKNLCNAD